MRQAIRILSFIAVMLIPASTQAVLVATKEVSLPKTEAQRLENIACISRHKTSSDKITAYQYSEEKKLSSFDYAYVQCKPHGTFKSSPTYFSSRCDFKDKQWSCDESELHIQVTINNRKVDVVPGETKPELADDVLKKISRYGGFGGRSIDKGIGDHCRFYSTSDKEELDISCVDNIRVSFWCPQTEITNCPRILSMNLILD